MEAMTAPSIETRLPLLAAAIGAHIPGAQVRLFGSRARGNASPDSDIDLLITVPDIWLASHDRWLTLSELRRRLAMVDVSLDLLLFSEAEVAERQHWQSHVIGQAYREGQLLHGPLLGRGLPEDGQSGPGNRSGEFRSGSVPRGSLGILVATSCRKGPESLAASAQSPPTTQP
jgi:predicted nucleotidyltransferase